MNQNNNNNINGLQINRKKWYQKKLIQLYRYLFKDIELKDVFRRLIIYQK